MSYKVHFVVLKSSSGMPLAVRMQTGLVVKAIHITYNSKDQRRDPDVTLSKPADLPCFNLQKWIILLMPRILENPLSHGYLCIRRLLGLPLRKSLFIPFFGVVTASIFKVLAKTAGNLILICFIVDNFRLQLLYPHFIISDFPEVQSINQYLFIQRLCQAVYIINTQFVK